ncbi:MAG: serine/threonine protein kinase [Muribaculaceae bacterium]|nr:serine/threonine protein kinase [Muribaculaceae bacterium]
MVSQEILNYVIIRKIGEGGMGQVFLAKNRSIHQFVAIKMLHPRFGGSPELRERFRQEAIMLSSLDHPNIVKFLNYVENEQGVFLIMEYVDGMTLEDFINRKNGLIVEERAYPMMLSIIDAFSYAHSRGIVHRDIKPGNILIGRDGTVKILDFGIAQIVSESDDRDLRGGTVSYMSPEQTLDRPLDIRSDIYSLGVLFWQMLTGRAPYDESELSAFEIKKCIQEQPLPPMKKAYSYISDAIQ